MEIKNARLLHGDCLEKLKTLPADALDSLVTDPPAGISFMGKDWDGDKGGRDEWVAWMRGVMAECYRVLKPGAHGLVWGLPRTSHWTATALEDAGFEVRDVVTHLFGTGFPKSMNLEKATNGVAVGQGTALKPASEHWILVRKPCSEKTVAANVLKHGTGGINVDGCRVASGADYSELAVTQGGKTRFTQDGANRERISTFTPSSGRFPANLILDEEAAAALDVQSGVLKSGSLNPGHKQGGGDGYGYGKGEIQRAYGGDTGGASRFFYVAKASKSDKGADNTHPTVKSTALMRYLLRLVTPPSGLVLDPFMGSGSTGVAAMQEGFRFVGVERELEYYAIAKGRIGTAIEERDSEPTEVQGAV